MINLDQIGLDSETVSRHSEVAKLIGDLYQKKARETKELKERELSLIAAGTNFRQAGANLILLNESQAAKECFDLSSEAYSQVSMAYSQFLGNLGKGEMHFANTRIIDSHDPTDVFWLWSPNFLQPNLINDSREKFFRLRTNLNFLSAKPIGVLGLPVRIYLELFDATNLLIYEHQINPLKKTLIEILFAYSEALRRSQQNEYHWSILAMPFHPVEPDIIGLLVALSRRMKEGKHSLRPILEEFIEDRGIHLLLKGALEQFGAWESKF